MGPIWDPIWDPIYDCYSYNNIGEWVSENFDTAAECVAEGEGYFWIDAGNDECGVCNGPGLPLGECDC